VALAFFTGITSPILSSMGKGFNQVQIWGASPANFWYGFVVAVTGQLLLILSLAAWAILRLDAQKGFDRYPLHKPMMVDSFTTQQAFIHQPPGTVSTKRP
jgi:hypothetical protein